MANDLNNGAERLTGRIIEKAREDAAEIARAAEAEEQKIKELAAREAEHRLKSIEESGRKAAENILERSRTNAQLDARKQALAARRQVLDRAFEIAEKKLCDMEGGERDALIKDLAISNAWGGEVIRPSAADMDRVIKNLADINRSLEEKGRAPLSVGESAPIEGGFLLVGEGYDMNCSFRALLEDYRNKQESGVAKLLFG